MVNAVSVPTISNSEQVNKIAKAKDRPLTGTNEAKN